MYRPIGQVRINVPPPAEIPPLPSCAPAEIHTWADQLCQVPALHGLGATLFTTLSLNPYTFDWNAVAGAACAVRDLPVCAPKVATTPPATTYTTAPPEESTTPVEEPEEEGGGSALMIGGVVLLVALGGGYLYYRARKK
jgi:hypothetical protein